MMEVAGAVMGASHKRNHTQQQQRESIPMRTTLNMG